MGAMERMAKVPNGQLGQWVRFVSSAILIPAVVALLIWIIAIERRLTAIEANRFTAADGIRLVELLNSKADRSEVPPPEVRQRLDRIDKDIQEIKQMIRELK